MYKSIVLIYYVLIKNVKAVAYRTLHSRAITGWLIPLHISIATSFYLEKIRVRKNYPFDFWVREGNTNNYPFYLYILYMCKTQT